MDTLTHAVSGAVLAAAVHRPERSSLPLARAMGVAALAAAFPDSDFIFRLVDTLTYLNVHRGVTHSLLMLPLWTLFLAWVFSRILRPPIAWRAYWRVCALGLGIHILGDVITTYGTRIFAPVSDYKVSLSTTFILDAYLSSVLLVGLLGALGGARPRRWALAALTVAAVYISGQFLLRNQALEVARSGAREMGIEALAVHALPQPLSPLHWKLLLAESDFYHEANLHLARDRSLTTGPDSGWFARLSASYRPANELVWTPHPRFGQSQTDRHLARSVWADSALAGFRRFALYPVLYRIDRNPNQENCVWFADLRFTLTGRVPPFRFGGCRIGANDPWRLRQLP